MTTAESGHNAKVAAGIAEVYALGAGAVGSGPVLEPLQNDAQHSVNFQQQFETAVGAHVNHGVDLTHILANAPDFRHLGLSLAVLAAIKAASVAERMRRGTEAPDQPRAWRLIKKAGWVALSSVAAYGAYKSGALMNPEVEAIVGLGTTVTAAAYMHGSQASAARKLKTR